MMLRLRIAMAIAGFVSCHAGSDRAYTVCEVMDRLEDFSCRPIRLKAKLESGTDTWLVDESCTKALHVGGITFGPTIVMRWPDSLLVGCRIDFSTDERAYKTVYKAINSREGRNGKIELVIDGVVETRRPAHALVARNGAPIGFGHLGGAPAQIIVERVIELKVTPKDPSSRVK
jgi:hypothetical protein